MLHSSAYDSCHVRGPHRSVPGSQLWFFFCSNADWMAARAADCWRHPIVSDEPRPAKRRMTSSPPPPPSFHEMWRGRSRESNAFFKFCTPLQAPHWWRYAFLYFFKYVFRRLLLVRDEPRYLIRQVHRRVQIADGAKPLRSIIMCVPNLLGIQQLPNGRRFWCILARKVRSGR